MRDFDTNCARRICVAPMMDWTDRHCRYFHRQLSRHVYLYTEMITTSALLFGDIARHLFFMPQENPIALQLGGSEPNELAHCAKLAEWWGYDEINLNCGCPSERVQRNAFGACLMKEATLVTDCVKAICDKVTIPVTVKHRIGVNGVNNYGFVRDFVGTVAQGGCHVFIVHARNAILHGLSPKKNREIPELKYNYAYRLKHDFPKFEIIINGGIKTLHEASTHLRYVDGVMIGRQFYHHPYLLADVDRCFYSPSAAVKTRSTVELAMREYIYAEHARGTYIGAITRHMLGLYRNQPGAKSWRRILSDPQQLSTGNFRILDEAHAQIAAPPADTYKKITS
ncbi:tRNA dihydrouridine(20/20a) synthase DusA [Candidatus Vallotia lariciata]|uniref:tRNA dihydrouridine(20/20a) synthase DusA n=1 Tax=Candidatus Vallotia laricis TaxID=2018052 RepID=UPI001D01E74E|nr:tRNA dihydrouridine(20/20a) synthase DusA [Candidatus Vallotia lariciata]UDG83019.1 tRNA-dihydrouridine(20/20a) synthase [Candidatus Vallotia lariciata]